MKIYAISGLGADERAYKRLDFYHELTVLKWIKPLPNERIESYSARLAESINTEEEFGIIGLSFGGLIAVEMSKKLKPVFTVLISTIELGNEMPWFYKLTGKIGIIRILPERAFKIPAWLISPLFNTRNKALVKEIINDTDSAFVKWAISELVVWNNKDRLKNVLKIKGTADYLFPAISQTDTVMVQGGGHFMIVDNAKEISRIILRWITSEYGQYKRGI